jgi:translocation and assembly module TamA
LDTKERCYFGTTIFNTDFFNKNFLTRFLKHKPGDRYSSQRLRDLENSMANGVFFQHVEIRQNLDTELRDIPIEIVVTPKKSRQYTWGLGYGTDTGMRGFLEARANYLTNTCHSLKGQTQVSEVQNRMALHYLIPGNYPPTDLYDLGITGETLHFKQGNSTVGALGLGYTTSLKNWRQMLKISLQYERYNLRGQLYKTSTLVLSSIHWSRSKKDDLIKPNRGYNISASVTGATKYTLSTSSFLQTQLKAKFMQPLSSRTLLILNSVIGFTAIDDINQLPLSLQFYAGGTQSIRGFSYNSIGPGTNLILGSATLRQKISKQFYLEAFIDTGNVSNNLLGKLARGVGCGIVWRTIIGSVGLSYAKAISRPGSPGMFHISIGPEL